MPQNNKIIELKDLEALILYCQVTMSEFTSGAIGVQQLKKLPNFIKVRRENAKVFKKLFYNNPFLIIQKEIEKSSWFGFSFIVKSNAPYDRDDLIKVFNKNNIECRPIVSGNFTKNEVIKYYDYTIHGTLENSENIHKNGIFINHPYDITKELTYVKFTKEFE